MLSWVLVSKYLALFLSVDGQYDEGEENWQTGNDEASLMSENFIGIGVGSETIEDSSAFGSQESLNEPDDDVVDDVVTDGYEVYRLFPITITALCC